MTTQISNRMACAILACETGEVVVTCLTFEHESLAEPIRIVNDTVEIVRAAGTFQSYPFEPDLPEDTEEAGGTATLSICNVDKAITQQLKSIDGIPMVTMEVVLVSQPDTVEMGPFEFDIQQAEHDQTTLTLTLGHEEDFMNQAIPAQTYTPSNSPGAWP
jgi:hypothetical protein